MAIDMSDRAVTVPFEAASWLVAHNLNQLWTQSQDPVRAEMIATLGRLPCCPRCCGPCEAINMLNFEGLLDDLAAPHGADSAWWDPDAREVDRQWLASAWHTLDQCDSRRHDDD